MIPVCTKNRKKLQKNTKTKDFQPPGTEIFAKSVFCAIFVQKIWQKGDSLYGIGNFTEIYENAGSFMDGRRRLPNRSLRYRKHFIIRM